MKIDIAYAIYYRQQRCSLYIETLVSCDSRRVRIFDSGEVENGDLDNGVDYYFFIITKAMIIVTLSRKTLQGTLQSLKCNADAEIRRQNVRTVVGVQRAEVTQSFSGKESSSAPCEKTQVTSQL